MHRYILHRWEHSHRFNINDKKAEHNTRKVVLLTVIMMVVEIAAGILYKSMALLADGWHMGTHAAALGITVFAYSYARRHAGDPRYTFGTGKVGSLGGFASAVALALVALFMVAESVRRLITPETIHFNQAIIVAVVGLGVNLVSAFILQGHPHPENKDNTLQHHHDPNLKAAYLHVIADALTSVLAIIALFTGKMLGWVWMDPIMGIVGAVIITHWAYGLLSDTSRTLLDSGVDQSTVAEISSAIEADSDNKVADLHVWRLGTHHIAAIISIVTHEPKDPDYYKKLLHRFKELAHISVEIHPATGEHCL